MTEANNTTEPRIEVTLENLPNLRAQIAAFREQPDRQEAALRNIREVREGAIVIGEHEHVVNLFWEEYLVGKHMLMAAISDDDKGKALDMMRTSAQAAAVYIHDNSVDSMRPRSHRFLGEVAMRAGDTKGAVEHFRHGISLFEQMRDPAQRVNALELSGFLAEALIRDGQVDAGIDTAVRTFEAYDSGDGAELRERDYYTWAVWKSGAATKAWSAILGTGQMPQGTNKDKLMGMLDASELILKMPEGQTAWGDPNFEIRRAELAGIRFGIDQIPS